MLNIYCNHGVSMSEKGIDVSQDFHYNQHLLWLCGYYESKRYRRISLGWKD